jgi:hypothetical protein
MSKVTNVLSSESNVVMHIHLSSIEVLENIVNAFSCHTRSEVPDEAMLDGVLYQECENSQKELFELLGIESSDQVAKDLMQCAFVEFTA